MDQIEQISLDKELQSAVQKNKVKLALSALERGANPNADINNTVPLFLIAISQKNYAMVEALATHGADTNVQAKSYNPPLKEAFMQGQEDIVILLAEHGAKAHIYNVNGKSLLQMAVDDGYEKLSSYLSTANVKNGGNFKEVLFFSLDNKQYDVALKLLQESFDSEEKHPLFNEVLFDALKSNDQEIIHMFTQHKNFLEDDKILLRYLTRYNHPKLIKQILDNKETSTSLDFNDTAPLRMAIGHNNQEIFNILTPYFKIDWADNPNKHLLVKAVENDNISIAKFLIEEGANSNQANEEHAPLSLAVKNGNIHMVRLLLKNGANYNKPYKDETPLSLSIDHYKSDILELLLEQDGINLATKHKTNTQYCGDAYEIDTMHSLISLACLKESSQMAMILINAGVPIDQTKASDEVALRIAAKYSYNDVVEELLKRGADPYAERYNGRMALDLAKDKAIIKLLKIAMGRSHWSKVNEDRMARKTTDLILEQDTTEIFNFSAKHVTTTIRNMTNDVESSFQRDFVDFKNHDDIEEACSEMNKDGADINPSLLFSAAPRKKVQKVKFPA